MTHAHAVYRERLKEDINKRVVIGPDDTKIEGFSGDSKKVRKIMEGKKPDIQCEQVGCMKKKSVPSGSYFCYICGYQITDSGGCEKKNPFGLQKPSMAPEIMC